MTTRNFCIIAHIDHGKSTLADRMLELTQTLEKREMKTGQMLDTMDLEQERGITIKLTPVRMYWKDTQLNLIDTPGHVDFQYEVSRSLASVEGAILVVDATQGIEAQTLSNVYLALEHDLEIIPVLNKIDLPSADVDRVAQEVISLLGCKREDIIEISAKTGLNVEKVLDAVIERFPEPRKMNKNGEVVPSELGEDIQEVKGLIFDSQYDTYKGVVIYIKLFAGGIKKGDTLELLNTKTKFQATEVGCFSPKWCPTGVLKEGEIGYIVTGFRSVREAQVGDTIYRGGVGQKKPIPGFAQINPFIFAGIYPVDTEEYPVLKDSLEKLMLNDSSLTTEYESSQALGQGFRCGFLGLLHLDIVKERLWREFEMDVIMTSPQVTYRVLMSGDRREDFKQFETELCELHEKTVTAVSISNPEELPDAGTYIHIEEPIAKIEMITPSDYVGNLMQLAQDRRGKFVNQYYLEGNRVVLVYEIPMAELIGDYYDELKSRSSGYASLGYEFLRYQKDDLVKVDILIAGERVGALSFITHRERSHSQGKAICTKLKEHIPKAQFAIALQALIGGKIIARETISALRKDVTAKLYGGDVSRKRKLLEKQKKGKKKMKQFGKVSIPSETFVNILKKN